MKKNLGIASLAAVATVAIMSPAFAADDATPHSDNALLNAVEGKVSANVAYASDYRFRGISQTNEDFAIQGGFDYAMNSGFYLGTWASNVNAANGFTGAEAEVDLYGGYGFNVTDNTVLDMNVLYYYYPGASSANGNPDIDFIEYTPSIKYDGDPLSASIGVSYSPDYFFGSGDSFYYNGQAAAQLNSKLSLGAHLGYQNIEDNAQFGTPSYYDWSVSLTLSQFDLDWTVAYQDTSIDDGQCFGGGVSLCDDAVVGTVAKSF